VTQFAFHWPVTSSHSPLDFIVSSSNAQAVDFLESWPDGKNSIALLSGPQASGKTHLIQGWILRTEATVIDKTMLGKALSTEFWNKASHAVLEDIQTVTDETALFHLLRHAESHQLTLLLTSSLPAPEFPCSLPDLKSRLLALPAITIAPPDEILLHGYVMKYFSDHQLRVHEDVIHYLVRRTERSFTALLCLLERIEKTSIETKRDITIPLIKPLVEKTV